MEKSNSEVSETLERRVEIVEAELRDLKEGVRVKKREKDWRRTVGSAKDDPLFDEMIELGRAYREKQKPDAGS